VKIEAVTVCVDYADYLEITLPYIRRAVDDLVVVTSPADRRTRALCAKHGVEMVITDDMHADGRRFSLGAAVAAGVDALAKDDWVLVIDADIFLPADAGDTLRSPYLDRSKLYGIDRVHCRGRAAWERFQTEPGWTLTFEVPYLREFPVGARMRLPNLGGYAPCGFFGLWHPVRSGVMDYPIHPRGTAEGSDMMHAARWGRGQRELIPDVVGIQLETVGAAVGVNWAGRRTPEFSLDEGPYRR
jgi:hypothetical protein